MTWSMAFIFIVAIVLALLLGGVWVAVALGSAGLIGIWSFGLTNYLSALGSIAFNNINSFTLTAVPLFVLMGEIVMHSGITARFYHGVTVIIGKFPGGLLHSNIVACAFFAAISGSSVATAAAIGSIAIPEQKERGYNHKMIFGSIGGGGTLGLLIPPSIPMIVYGVLAEESVARLFMAGVIPGLMIAAFFIIYIAIRVKINPSLAPEFTMVVTKKELRKALIDIFPIVLLVACIMGGIYTGITTPTEAAAFSVVLAVILAIMEKGLTWEVIKKSLRKTVETSCMVLFIIIGASILSFFIVQAGINRGLTEWVVANHFTPTTFLLLMIVIYFILGCLMDGISMIYLTLPVIMPIILELGIDIIWFGVFLVILIELGQITPPVGMNLFVIKGISGGSPIEEVIFGVLPYFAILLGSILLFMIFPNIVLFLPSTM